MIRRFSLICKRIKRKLINNLQTIYMILFAVNPIIGIFINGKELIIIQIIVNFIIAILIFADQYIHNKYNDIPVMRKPLVRYEKSTNKVIMKPEDMYESLNYLSDLQEYFERKGML